jgi:molybdopterin/thiamine biosynthesis adenylyltransferase
LPHALVDVIDKTARLKKFPDNTAYQSISVDTILNISKKFSVSGHEIEILALEHGIVPERYARNMKTFSLQDQTALLKSRVSVVGLGGLGGVVTEILARAGVGRLNLIDGDKFEDSNLNRQFISTCNLINTPKAAAAGQRVAMVNPSLKAETHSTFLDEKNATTLLENSAVAVDCLDNVKTRFILENACRQIGAPLVSAAVAGATGHITTIFPQDQGLHLIYGDPKKAPQRGAEASLGTVPYSVTLLAALQCAEVIKIIQKKGMLLRNKLMVVDLIDGIFEVLALTQ